MGASDPQLIDGHVSVAQSQKAITALLQHVHKEKELNEESELLPGKEQHVWLVMTVKRMQPNKTPKPHKIPIVHPLVDPRTSGVCLITKDPQREYKDLLESNDIKFISRVVGLQKLRGKFKGFDARRLLLRENDLFLADERVLPLLPRLLGKKWFEAKKQPIPVSLTKKALKTELENAISSTYMHQNRGTCTSIKIATTSQKDNQVLANLTTALPAVISRIHGGWENVQSLNIKTSGSVSLPIWTCPLGSEQPGSRWEGMVLTETEWSGFGAEAVDGNGEAVVEPMVDAEPTDMSKANGKKRAAESTETQAGTKKKAKKAKTSEDLTIVATKPIATATDLKSKRDEPNPKKKAAESVKEQPPLSLKKKRQSAPEPSSSLITPSPTNSQSKKQPTDRPLSRTELTEKRDALGDAQLAKKKGKLRDTEKSSRKGVKAQLVGRSKA